MNPSIDRAALSMDPLLAQPSIDRAASFVDGFGIVYIPPDKSKCYGEMQMRMLEEDIARFCSENERVLLAGDYNARTSDKLTVPDVDIYDFEFNTVSRDTMTVIGFFIR